MTFAQVCDYKRRFPLFILPYRRTCYPIFEAHEVIHSKSTCIGCQFAATSEKLVLSALRTFWQVVMRDFKEHT